MILAGNSSKPVPSVHFPMAADEWLVFHNASLTTFYVALCLVFPNNFATVYNRSATCGICSKISRFCSKPYSCITSSHTRIYILCKFVDQTNTYTRSLNPTMSRKGLCSPALMPLLKVCILLIIIVAPLATIQGANKQRKVYTSRTDLPNLHVNALAQDSLGYIWVGTANGLCRDKGNGYDIFSSDKNDSATIPSNHVTALLYRNGTLWVATVRGLASKAADSNVFVRYTVKSEKKHSEGYYHGFVMYHGKLYTYGYNGLYEIDADNQQLVPKVNFDRRDIEAAAIDRNGLLWVASGDELLCLDNNLNVSRRVSLPPENVVSSMLTDGDCILLGSPSGILQFNPENSQITQLPGAEALSNTPINTILPLQHTDKLLIGTRGYGPQLFDKTTGQLLSVTGKFNLTKIPSVDITAAFLDNESNLWFGTFDKGVFRIPARENVFNSDHKMIDAFRDHFVTRIEGDQRGRFWIGTRYRGLALYNPADTSVTYFSPKAYPWLNAFPTKFVQELFIDSADRLWVGMDNGLFVCTLSDGPFLHNLKTFPRIGNVVTIAEDSKHRVWVGSSDGGIRIFNPDLTEASSQTSPLFSSSNITRLMPYNDKTMLAASYLDNIYLIDIETLSATVLDPRQQQHWDTAIDVYRARNGHLWIGTYDNGLLTYDPLSRQLRHFTDFRSHDILAISEDAEGNIWCCSSYGIYRIDPVTARINTYLKHDGITGNQYHEKCSFTDKGGNIYFGGNYGIQQVIPANVDGTRRNIPIYLTELNTLNRKPDADDPLTKTDLPFLKRLDLDYDNNAISIGFTGLNYDTRMEYAYMLDGFDKMWIFPGEYNHAIYSNLPAGNYRFLVKVKDNDTWSDATELLEVSVSEAPWLHPLAKIGYVLFILLLILMLTQLYIRLRLEKERLTLAEKQMEDERQMSQRKLNFFNNISHELRTPITLIYAPVKFLRKNFRQMPPQEVESSLEYIDKNVDRLLTLTTQILKFRTIQGESLPLQVQWHDPVMQLDNMIRLYSIYAAEKDLSVNFTSSHPSIKAVYDSDKFEKIINNLLFNAVKYTPPKGHITVRLEITNHPEGVPDPNLGTYMEIQVTDDGVGIPLEERKTLFTRFKRILNPFTNRKEGGFGIGLNFVRHLVIKHHGVITYRPNAVKGTTFIVDIPAEASAYTPKEWAPANPDTPTSNTTAHEAVPNVITDPKTPKPDNGDASITPDERPDNPSESENEADTLLPDDEPVEESARHKILVVEDKKEMADFIASVFAAEADVTIAADGHTGLQKAVEELPDVIISDVMMPLMTGYEMLSRIKNEPATCHIPVVLLTAKSRDEDKIKGYDTGADLYMEKPFNPDVLHSAVNSILAKLERQKHQVVQTAGTAETPPADEMAPLDRKFLTRLYAYINDNIGNSDLNVNLLGRELGFSRTNFYRKIKALTGVTPNDLLRVCRLNRAAQLLLTREHTIGEISDMTGFGTQSHFSNLFKRQFGVTPRDYLLNHTAATGNSTSPQPFTPTLDSDNTPSQPL